MSVTTANFWSVVKPLVYPMAVTPWKLVMPWGSAFIGSNGGVWFGGAGKKLVEKALGGRDFAFRKPGGGMVVPPGRGSGLNFSGRYGVVWALARDAKGKT